ncbi:hypothetical protein MNBD_GAMMA26-1899 [hydrothermal vent metagenome]|uniref:DegT/DnrJ/EryC1/StrS aminotransferase n=1 Tax=hydrothermal vent metagenome TaxID=652676 RepID=A0A3B1B5C6_9ZZZZ
MEEIYKAMNDSKTDIIVSPLSIGQMYYPSDEELADIVNTIYANRYYTNHGPLAIEFEKTLSSYLGAKHVVASTNATLGLMMTLIGLGASGSVIVPSFCAAGVVEAVVWSGLTPVFCDVDENTGLISVDTITRVLRDDTCTIIAVSLWGNICGINEISLFAKKTGMEVIHFAVDSFGNSVNGKKVGGDGVTTVFSFDSSKILSCYRGGCVVTNDDMLASKIRNIRSSYGAGSFVNVPVTANGRFSEFQAAVGLWSLNNLEKHRLHNKRIYEIYTKLLVHLDGITVSKIDDSINSNYQYFVVTIDSKRYGLTGNDIQIYLDNEGILINPDCCLPLRRSNVFTKFHDSLDLHGAEVLHEKCLQLPIGSQITHNVANKIGTLVKDLKTRAEL